MYNADIRTIPHREQRYDTVGDFFADSATMKIYVSSMGIREYEVLVAVHELVEAELCRKMGITEQMVDAWDLAHEDEDEPGALPDCPYREAHLRAEAIERVLANDLAVDWEHYDRTVKAVVKDTPLPSDPTVHGKSQDYQREKPQKRYRAPFIKPKQKKRSVLRDR